MTRTARALHEHNDRILKAVRDGTADGQLLELMRIRAERIQALSAALAGGASLSLEEIQLIQRGERELHDSLKRRRDELARELSARHHAHRAGKSYQLAQTPDPRFVDSAG
jgi:hypothetical protein